jgi:hypothetical protein
MSQKSMIDKEQEEEEEEQDHVNPAEIDGGELAQFKQQVNRWCELDSKIKQYEQVVKTHKKLKDDLCGSILTFMEGYDITNLKTPFGKLQKVESYTKAPLTKGVIGEKITTYFQQLGVRNCKEQSETLLRDLYDNRERKKSVRLKRVPAAAAAKKSGGGGGVNVPESLRKL